MTATVYQLRDNLPPACVLSEQNALALMLYEARFRHHFLDADIGPEHFVYSAHKEILEEVLSQVASPGIVSPVQIIERLKDRPAFNIFGGAQAYIAGALANHWLSVTEMEIPGLIERLKDFANRRQLVATGEDLVARVWQEQTPATQIAAEFIDVVTEEVMTGHSVSARVNPIGKSVDGVMDDVEQGVLPYRMYAGTDKLNRKIGGWKHGMYYVIAGRPGMGKSTVAPSLLLQTAHHGHRVLYVSLEMTTDELTQRMLADCAYQSGAQGSISYVDIAEQILTQPQRLRLKQAAEYLRKQPVIISDAPGLNVAGLRQLIKSMERKHGKIDVVCIDHMGLLQPAQSYRGNKVAETEEVSNEMKRLAKEMNVAVVALMQLNRGTEQRDDKRPTLSDLRWSGAIEQDADVVMLLYREEYYLHGKKKPKSATDEEWHARKAECSNKLDLIVAKNRGGPTGDLKMFADMACCHVRDLG